MQNDAAGMAQQVAWAAGKPGVEDQLLANWKPIPPPIPGGLGVPGSFPVGQWIPPNGQKKRKPAAMYSAMSGLREALFGNAEEARRRATLAMGRSTGRDVQYCRRSPSRMQGTTGERKR